MQPQTHMVLGAKACPHCLSIQTSLYGVSVGPGDPSQECILFRPADSKRLRWRCEACGGSFETTQGAAELT
jgi:hypothetical protein